MAEKRCLYCYKDLDQGEEEWHSRCSLEFFGTPTPPILDYSNEQMKELAGDIVLRSIAVTGVQAKLSLTIEKYADDPKKSRLTIVGLWGKYILKPPSEEFAYLPENEDLTMHLGRIFGIETAEHSLMRLKSGELAYITKRFDRVGNRKLAMEDMCQLTETLTSDKYHGSMERIGRQIHRFSSTPGLDALLFFEMSLFCFLTGNSDMHLKNFSLLTTDNEQTRLSPAYDMLCTKLVLPDDLDDLALTLCAKKRKIHRKDFNNFANYLKIPPKTIERVYEKFSAMLKESMLFIESSFLPEENIEIYKDILIENAFKIQLI